MFGYVQSAGSFAGVVGDFLASALNQNVTSWRSAPAATTIEHQVIDWLKTMVGFDPAGSGILLSGGSFANFAGLAAALRASTDVDVNRKGVAALPGKPRVYASAMTHMSIAKGASLLGIGKDAVVAVPVDAAHRMDPVALARQIESDRANGYHAICAVATAGDVNTGAIDPLAAIADVCEANKLWLHVDGSYGALAAQSPHVAGAMSALARADSLSLDPHKWLYAPLDAGCLLVRDQRGAAPRLLRGRGLHRRRRRPRHVRLRLLGSQPRAVAALSRAQNLVPVEDPRRARDSTGDRRQHCRREAPCQADRAEQRLRAAGAGADEHRVLPLSTPGDDAFNKRLMVEVQRDGDSYLSNAMIGGRFALRACIVNYRTTPEDVEQLLATIRRVAARISRAV